MENRVALVTGGTGGIGTAICQHLAQLGVKVAAGYNKGGDHAKAAAWQAEQKARGYDITVCYGDVTDFESCGLLVASVTEILGPIEILVNNAGITEDISLKKMTLDHWQKVIHTNLDSIFNVTRHVINSMLEHRYGRIINISSVNGQKGQFGQCNYAAAKSGIHGFSKSLALEVAQKGITVNSVSPGYTATDMMAGVPDQILAKIIEDIPVGRLANPDEIARVVTFLAAPESAYITGTNIAINGGQHLY